MRQASRAPIACVLIMCGAHTLSHADLSALYFSTLAGSAGTVINSAEGTGSAAQFYSPRGVAVDGTGTVYVADSSNNTIRKVTASGVVTTIAGVAGSQGGSDGPGTSARFIEPYGVAVDSNGNLYIADPFNNTVRKITPAGVVTTLAGTAGTQGSTDGTGSAARFSQPRGITVDSSGNVYIADYENSVIRKVTPAGVVTTFAGVARSQGSTDGTGTAARFKDPFSVAADAAGNVYVADTANKTIRKITPAGAVTTLAGTVNSGGTTDATGTAARFIEPRGIAVDSSGTLYVADYGAHTIRRITSAGAVTTLAGSGSTPGTADGTGASARFYYPSGVTVDSAGNVYVADTSNNTIRKITSAGVVTTLAGLAGRSSSVDATGPSARFEDPYAIAADSTGNLYVADTSNGSIRKITAAGVVTTLAGTAGSPGLTDGTGSAARFRVPFDVAVDTSGNVYVSDHGNHAVRKITPAGVVTTLAGSGTAGSSDGTGTAASFTYPSGIAVDSIGNVLVADTDNQVIRRISPAGVVTTVGGAARVTGSTNGVGAAARFFNPKDVAADSNGNLYVADRGNHTIRKAGPLSTPNVSSDCLFDWAERNYASLFSPAASSVTLSPYYYRYYSGTQAYLGVSTADGHLYYLGAQGLVDAGALSGWLATAACQ